MFLHSRAVLNKLVGHVKKISRAVSLIVQIVFLIFYVYEIVLNYGNHVRFVAYIVLLSLSTVAFIVGICSKSARKTRKLIRFCKYPINLSLIILTLITIFNGQASDLKIILTGITILSFVANIVMEFIRWFVEVYAKMLKTSFDLDMQALENKFHFKDGRLNILDIPQMIANKLQAPQPVEHTQEQQRIIDLTNSYRQGVDSRNKAKKAQQRQNRKQRRQQNWQIIQQKLFGKKHNKDVTNALPPSVQEDDVDKD